MSSFLHYYIMTVNSFLLSFVKKCKWQDMGDKKVFSTRIDEDRIKDLKHLAVDEGRSLGHLLEEAIRDLLKKYKKKPLK